MDRYLVHSLAREGRVSELRAALRLGPLCATGWTGNDLDGPDPEGFRPLRLAAEAGGTAGPERARAGHVACVRLLLAAGADPLAAQPDGTDLSAMEGPAGALIAAAAERNADLGWVEAALGYCRWVREHPEAPGSLGQDYHDLHYGVRLEDDRDLLCRLVMEINQAGLSWMTILKKEAGFRSAYGGFDPRVVAAYGPADRDRLLADPGIIRNRLKVDAAIHNARVVLALTEGWGSFRAWLDGHDGRGLDSWLRLFRWTFRFTGGEIVREFLTSIGMLPGAHVEGCTSRGAFR